MVCDTYRDFLLKADRISWVLVARHGHEEVRRSTRVVRRAREVVAGGAGPERALANQEEILRRMERLEAGMAEILARLRSLEDDEELE